MRLGLFMMPMHPAQRDPVHTLQEDREAIILSHSHPTLVAAHAAMFDHLAKGRFIFGISPGALASDAEALGLGLAMEERNKLFAESIDVILAIWEREAPYDIDFPGNRFKVTTAQTLLPELGRGYMYKPYQKPRPEIVGTVVAPR